MDLAATVAGKPTRPIDVMRALTERFGIDWLTWSHDALRMTLERELHVEASPKFLAQALAAAAVAIQDAFWRQWEHFHFLTQALNGAVPDPVNHAELTVGQMMRAVLQATRIRAELKQLSYFPEFSDDVARYVAAQALHDGVWYLPPPLEFAARHASGLRYRCRDCGNESEVTVDDGLCDVCVNRFDTSRLGAWRPDPERLAKGWGSNIVFFEKNPTEAVRRRLDEVRAHPGRALQENPTDVCVARLHAALTYAEAPPAPEESA